MYSPLNDDEVEWMRRKLAADRAWFEELMEDDEFIRMAALHFKDRAPAAQ